MFKKEIIIPILLLTFCAFALLVLSSCTSSKSATQESNTLIVGTNPFPPYESINDAGEWEGFDIDIAKKIADNLGKTLVVKEMAFDSLIMALKQGKIDMIIAGVSITAERQKEIAMIHYHGKPTTTFPLVFWGKIPQSVTSIEDVQHLPNKTICVQTGQIQADFLDTYKDIITVKKVPEVTDCIMEIKYHKSIACVLESAVAAKIKKEHPEMQIIDVPICESIQNLGHGIGVKKENTKLAQQIKTIVSSLKESGSIAKLATQWGIKP